MSKRKSTVHQSWRQEAAVPLLAQLKDSLVGAGQVNSFHSRSFSRVYKPLGQHSPFILNKASKQNCFIWGRDESSNHLVVPIFHWLPKCLCNNITFTNSNYSGGGGKNRTRLILSKQASEKRHKDDEPCRAVISSTKSIRMPVTIWVPKGSIPGPILFCHLY